VNCNATEIENVEKKSACLDVTQEFEKKATKLPKTVENIICLSEDIVDVI
jgi:hypothetical protein